MVAIKATPTRLILVDGYNVVRSTQRYGAHMQRCDDHSPDPYNAAREALLNDVASFAPADSEAAIIFDGAGNSHQHDKTVRLAHIEVTFSPPGVSADALIERRARAAAAAGREVLVISSDASIQWTVVGKSVTRMSAAGFVDELESARAEYASDRKLENSKMTLAERINPEAAARLEAWLRAAKE
jgi:predicted RNA-binding protein with PIN domain